MSEWQVSTQYCCGKQIYQVYRIRNINGVDHCGNREFNGVFDTVEEAQHEADRLNAETA